MPALFQKWLLAVAWSCLIQVTHSSWSLRLCFWLPYFLEQWEVKKKEYANVVAVIIDSPFIISLVRILWTLDSWCSCSEFKSYMLINPEHLLYFRIPCECYKEIFSSVVNINNNYLVFITLLILKLFPKFKSFLGNVIGDEVQFCPC